MQKEMEVLMNLKNIRKTYPGVVAVNDVNLNIFKGEVHIIIGENGAGKSTLVKVMAGLTPKDSGTMVFGGDPYDPKHVLDAQHVGINIIHQELNLMQNRTVAQNIFVGREPVKKYLRIVDEKKMNAQCSKLMKELGIDDIEPDQLVKDLSIAKQQMVEVAKANSTHNKLLIMDEPTSSLTQHEIDKLFDITRRLKKQGTSIIYISHRMQELMQIGDRVTVMRDGSYVGTRDIEHLKMQELVAMMVGRKIENIYYRTFNNSGPEVLRTNNLTGLRFRNVNISIHAGEIVGIAGLIGAGRTELAKSIFGYDPIIHGSLFFEGKEIDLKNYDSSAAVDKSLSLLPENRKTEGLFTSMTIEENIVQSSWRKLFKNRIINNHVVRKVAEEGVKNLRIATTSIKKRVSELSGGNQQKVVIAKWLVEDGKLCIFDEPTRGIDIGAKSEIYHIMNDLAARGAAILMISSDLPELIGMADRIYVMKDGEILDEVNRKDPAFNQEGILAIAIGGSN